MGLIINENVSYQKKVKEVNLLIPSPLMTRLAVMEANVLLLLLSRFPLDLPSLIEGIFVTTLDKKKYHQEF